MNDQELRSLVRAAVARHMGDGLRTGTPVEPRPASTPAPLTPILSPVLSSHALYTGLVNVGDACVIEPAVSCDHCGYCKSHGY